MTTSTPQAKVLTVSDGVIAGTRDDRSGEVVAAHLAAAGFEVVERQVVADGVAPVADALRALAAGFAIAVAVVAQRLPPGVDTEADLAAVEAALLAEG